MLGRSSNNIICFGGKEEGGLEFCCVEPDMELETDGSEKTLRQVIALFRNVLNLLNVDS